MVDYAWKKLFDQSGQTGRSTSPAAVPREAVFRSSPAGPSLCGIDGSPREGKVLWDAGSRIETGGMVFVRRKWRTKERGVHCQGLVALYFNEFLM